MLHFNGENRQGIYQVYFQNNFQQAIFHMVHRLIKSVALTFLFVFMGQLSGQGEVISFLTEILIIFQRLCIEIWNISNIFIGWLYTEQSLLMIPSKTRLTRLLMKIHLLINKDGQLGLLRLCRYLQDIESVRCDNVLSLFQIVRKLSYQ